MEVMYSNIKSPFIEELFEPANYFGLRFYVSVNRYGHVEILPEILVFMALANIQGSGESAYLSGLI